MELQRHSVLPTHKNIPHTKKTTHSSVQINKRPTKGAGVDKTKKKKNGEEEEVG